MRKLHLVGLTTDRDGLIFTARKGSKSGGFIVPLDERLLKAIVQAGDEPTGGQPAAGGAGADGEATPKRLRSESALTPREMQARLRAGRSIGEVAEEAGVDTEWVARFAVPILAEQAQVVELARALVYAKPRLGDSSESLGTSVLQNLSDRGVFLPDDVANAGWSAFQLHDAVWMVRFRYRARARDQEAQWEIDVPAGRLRARNRHASDLGYIAADRWAAEPDPLPNDDAAVAVAARRPRKAAAKTAAARRPASAKTAAARRPAAAKTAAATTKSIGTTKATRTAKGAASTTRAARVAGTTKAAARKSTRPVGPTKAPRTTRTAPTKASRATGTAKAQRVAGTTRAPRATSAAKAPAKSATRTTRATPAARRPAKATPPTDAGPTAGSGGVRLAVAQVSTARVAASMAAAEREPWAAAVRRPGRVTNAGGGAGAQRVEVRRPASRPLVVEPERSRRPPEAVQGRAFQPRPLPPPGQEPQPPRVRKVTVPAPRRTAEEEVPAVSLPAARTPSPRAEPMPVERPKRRRLRPR